MSDPSRAKFDLVADQAEIDAQAGIFGVYLSAMDFDDNFYTLMDSIDSYRQHHFHYDEGIFLIARLPDFQAAQSMAESLHQVVLCALPALDFQAQYDLQIADDVRHRIQYYQDATDFSIYKDVDGIIQYCLSMNWDLECLQFDEEQDEEDFYDDLDREQAVIEELREKEQYDRLDQLREALKIGKFAFVHPPLAS